MGWNIGVNDDKWEWRQGCSNQQCHIYTTLNKVTAESFTKVHLLSGQYSQYRLKASWVRFKQVRTVDPLSSEAGRDTTSPLKGLIATLSLCSVSTISKSIDTLK